MVEEPSPLGVWCASCGKGFLDLGEWVTHKYGSETPDFAAGFRECSEPQNVTAKPQVRTPNQRQTRSRERALARKALKARALMA